MPEKCMHNQLAIDKADHELPIYTVKTLRAPRLSDCASKLEERRCAPVHDSSALDIHRQCLFGALSHCTTSALSSGPSTLAPLSSR
ncbi:hypothetical protein SCHPADRAFT_911605 [Schizopora paradoxa]|uniref:Uncharacterized protein n=1 Tax=Schizopora paradoxa TaxID=27342 RepID=A0A0H2R500_9AGAM|nr:hypothetical protein SCHPADRAFT_911605 [Schizopora paradoxa]